MTYVPHWHIEKARGVPRERERSREAQEMREMEHRHRTIRNTRHDL